jgi:hypothetical protein
VLRTTELLANIHTPRGKPIASTKKRQTKTKKQTKTAPQHKRGGKQQQKKANKITEQRAKKN